jgi:hypothetical protein
MKSKKSVKKDMDLHTTRSWVAMFFRYALEKKKSFYWEWDDFIITVRQTPKKIIVVLDRYLKKPPYIDRNSWMIPEDEVIPFLLGMYDQFPSSVSGSRNSQSSRRYLSFRSFVSMILNKEIRKLEGLWRQEDERDGPAMSPADIFLINKG